MLLKKFVLILFLSISSSCAFIKRSCIQWETYKITEYKMAPFDLSDHWFSHSMHFTPRKLTRTGFRSKWIYRCCEPGYEYTFGQCVPVCNKHCPRLWHCEPPDQCVCDNPFLCEPVQPTTKEIIEDTTQDTTPAQPPCNNSCTTNEECSISLDICICKDGFQRSNVSIVNSTCVPKCQPECLNADCTAPNTCTCWPHYNQTNDTVCSLQCSERTCIFGECNGNGTCICNEGFLSNGTGCVWAGDAILNEPDNCNCWSEVPWKKNQTDRSERECVPMCEGDYSQELVAEECIDHKQCQCYEGYLICHSDMYKCFSVDNTKALPSSTTNYLADQVVAENKTKSKTVLILIAGFSTIAIVLGISLLIWQKRRFWFNRLWSYNHMDVDPDREADEI